MLRSSARGVSLGAVPAQAMWPSGRTRAAQTRVKSAGSRNGAAVWTRSPAWVCPGEAAAAGEGQQEVAVGAQQSEQGVSPRVTPGGAKQCAMAC
ncbi:hypothetical protein CP975_34590 [Streptomyces alboniger]|uniref:Uncharacterized protein n=1 Tax=Streptomyces alboniger TaxID=132473 RepID=A0A5J6HY64_STRAD|nr:hypothetical protein CP975_34590 [Streptomyces alboniger]